jgi:hypothetical protein
MTPSELVPFASHASRIELLVRIAYGFIFAVLFYVWAAYVGLLAIVQVIHILILGRRSESIFKSTRRFVAAWANAYSYLSCQTDKRPELIPDLVLFSEDQKRQRPTGARYCTSCGAEILRTANFCGRCGSRHP